MENLEEKLWLAVCAVPELGRIVKLRIIDVEGKMVEARVWNSRREIWKVFLGKGVGERWKVARTLFLRFAEKEKVRFEIRAVITIEKYPNELLACPTARLLSEFLDAQDGISVVSVICIER